MTIKRRRAHGMVPYEELQTLVQAAAAQAVVVEDPQRRQVLQYLTQRWGDRHYAMTDAVLERLVQRARDWSATTGP